MYKNEKISNLISFSSNILRAILNILFWHRSAYSCLKVWYFHQTSPDVIWLETSVKHPACANYVYPSPQFIYSGLIKFFNLEKGYCLFYSSSSKEVRLLISRLRWTVFSHFLQHNTLDSSLVFFCERTNVLKLSFFICLI